MDIDPTLHVVVIHDGYFMPSRDSHLSEVSSPVTKIVPMTSLRFSGQRERIEFVSVEIDADGKVSRGHNAAPGVLTDFQNAAGENLSLNGMQLLVLTKGNIKLMREKAAKRAEASAQPG